MDMRIAPLLSLVALPIGACDSIGGVCTLNFQYGIQITVIDSLTGLPPAAAALVATSGTFVDSVGPRAPSQPVANGPSVLVLSTAGERPGIYSVVVRAPGYREWGRTNIRVTADRCHVRPTTLTAHLQS